MFWSLYCLSLHPAVATESRSSLSTMLKYTYFSVVYPSPLISVSAGGFNTVVHLQFASQTSPALEIHACCNPVTGSDCCLFLPKHMQKHESSPGEIVSLFILLPWWTVKSPFAQPHTQGKMAKESHAFKRRDKWGMTGRVSQVASLKLNLKGWESKCRY